jgi:hypothetical protein
LPEYGDGFAGRQFGCTHVGLSIYLQTRSRLKAVRICNRRNPERFFLLTDRIGFLLYVCHHGGTDVAAYTNGDPLIQAFNDTTDNAP